jgi:signal transduction histidine kinase
MSNGPPPAARAPAGAAPPAAPRAPGGEAAPRSAAAAARRRFWRYARTLAVPLLLWGLVAFFLYDPVNHWLEGQDSYDRTALEEWLDESHNSRQTLPELAADYIKRLEELADKPRPGPGDDATDARFKEWRQAEVKRNEVREHLRDLADPPTKMYAGQLPLFPLIYRIEVRFDDHPDATVFWDSGLPYQPDQVPQLPHRLPGARATALVRYQLHAFNKRQRAEGEHRQRLQQLTVLAGAATLLVAAWVVVVQRREHRQMLAQQQVADAERLLLDQARRHEETERKLLEQRLATQAAERQALELKSQLYASIGIMAGSYAHNIKNLLVRPNDLLRRCLEADGLSADQQSMLHEVQQTLGTVTERLQQILRTVRRDPNRAEPTRIDLNGVLRDLERTWRDLARDRYKLDLALELSPADDSLWVDGDYSHLQQAVENLLFNARDATFEMRGRLRDEARRDEGLNPAARKQALIAAAAWRGRVTLRSRREGDCVVLEVADNGVGMTDEVRARCTETHFTTKRDNAVFEGMSTGMGLGLSFVVAILDHHHARLEIDSAPLKGTTFRVWFPAAAAS